MKCPKCNANWDGGDIYEVLFKRTKDSEDCYIGYEPEQIELIAKEYGWTKENPVRFQRLITVKRRNGSNCWQCPDCKHYFYKDPTIKRKAYLIYSQDMEPMAVFTDRATAEAEIFNNNSQPERKKYFHLMVLPLNSI
jgi:ribosomal protein L37AE/L43A